jgi:hypothetical protein
LLETLQECSASCTLTSLAKIQLIKRDTIYELCTAYRSDPFCIYPFGAPDSQTQPINTKSYPKARFLQHFPASAAEVHWRLFSVSAKVCLTPALRPILHRHPACWMGAQSVVGTRGRSSPPQLFQRSLRRRSGERNPQEGWIRRICKLAIVSMIRDLARRCLTDASAKEGK